MLIAYLPAKMHFLQPAEALRLQSLGFKFPEPPLAGDALPGPVFSPQGAGCLPVGPDLSPTVPGGSPSVPVPVLSPGQQVEDGEGDQAIHVQSYDEMKDGAAEEEFDPRHSKAFGQPMVCRFEMSKRQITDGFGLCSPGRWVPAAREKLASKSEAEHARCLREIIGRFVDEKIKDVRRESFRLATGKLEGPPFSQADMDRLRREVAGTLDDPAGALEVPSGQPFFLHMLAQSLGVLGDPDWEILTQGEECYANGMPLGCEKPFPRAPQVFAPRSKYRKLDETPFDPCMINYTSAELSADQLEAQFREDERAGMMIATTEGAVKQEFGEGQLLIAAMGALVKPSGQTRPLHDGTHGIRLNNSIKVLDRLEHPGPADIVEVVAQAADAGEAPFCICADIAMAHRRAKVRRKDWPKLGCKARSDSKVIWLNCVGTFGVSSAAILWARLFGCVGRWVLRVLGPGFNLQVIFVDDLHVVVVGPRKFRTLWTIICAYLLVGTPFAFHKFKGGVAVEFVGFFLSYEKACAGVSEKRLAWIIEWIDKAEGAGWYVTGRRFSEFLGRLNFVGRLLTWLRPFLAPLFSFNAVLHRGTVARMPAMVHISLVYIRGELRKVGGFADGEANVAGPEGKLPHRRQV